MGKAFESWRIWCRILFDYSDSISILFLIRLFRTTAKMDLTCRYIFTIVLFGILYQSKYDVHITLVITTPVN